MFRKYWAATVLVLACTVQAGSVTGDEIAKPAKHMKAPFVHVVTFHLKKDAPKGETDAIIADAHGLLAKIGSVRGVWAGRTSDAGAGKFNKKFDVGLLVLLDDGAGLKKYLEDPLHLEFVKRHIPHIDQDKLAVFDFVNQKAEKKEEK